MFMLFNIYDDVTNRRSTFTSADSFCNSSLSSSAAAFSFASSRASNASKMKSTLDVPSLNAVLEHCLQFQRLQV